MLGLRLPPQWIGLDVYAVFRPNPATLVVGNEPAIHEVLALVAIRPGSDEPDWSTSLLGASRQHIRLIASLPE